MLSLVISDDYKYVVNRESVRVYNRHGIMLGSVADAKRLMQSKSERAPSEGQYLGLGVDFRLPHPQVSYEVVPGCFITDTAGIAYCVLSVDPPGTYQGTWNCRCIALMVLGHTITWHNPANQTDAFASPIIDQSGTVPAQPCAIQEVACEEVTFQGIVQGFRRTYKIWLLADVTLSLGAIGIDDAGVTYTVLDVNTRNRLDELICVTCVVEP